jgi:FlgN protein
MTTMVAKSHHASPSPAAIEDLHELSRILWHQRQLVEALLYRVEIQQALLTAGKNRWIAAAAHDIDDAIDSLRAAELERAVQVARVSAHLGLATPEPRISELLPAVGAPWDTILSDHQQSFLAMTSEIETLTRANRELLSRGYQTTREVLASLTGSPLPTGYGPDGSLRALETTNYLIDEAV